MSLLSLPDRAETMKTVETLAIGAGGAALFYILGLPGGLISGAMVAVAGTAMLGARPVGLPQPLAHVILMTLGLSIGAMVTPQLVHDVSAYPVTIALLAAATFCATFGSSFYLQRVHGWDRTSALLAGSPGALSQIIMLGTERGADVPGIAVVQITRVMVLTAGIPLLLAALGFSSPAMPTVRGEPATWSALLILVAAGASVSLFFRWINFPASWMFGAMLASSVLHGTGIVHGGLPQWAYLAALTGIGTLIGSRFGKISARTIAGHVGAAFGSFGVAILISAVFVTLITWLLPVRFNDVVVAFAPGAMDAMMALALTLHIDPVFVGAHHLSRFVYVSIATPGIVHLFGKADDSVDD
jgi:membrane AbrB-like protein